MCGGSKGSATTEKKWKTASPSDTANRGAEPQANDQAKRLAATSAVPGSTLGGTSTAPVTSSVLGG